LARDTVTRCIGLLGGTFDPVHNAHLALGRVALDTLVLDELRWVPAGTPWQKARIITAAEHRVAMLQLALAGEPRYRLERCELERTGPSYTLDTVRGLQQREPDADWFLVVGQDQFANLHTWHGWQELLTRVTLAVAARPGAPPVTDARLQGLAPRILPLPAVDIAASTLRQRVARGQSIDGLVPPAVARYIDQHALYLRDGAYSGS
jgi:nicotinate-nucleotide adenylyltransferase